MRASQLLTVIAAAAVAFPAAAQPARPATAPDPDLGQPDWSRAAAHVARARAVAGQQWAAEAQYFCYPGARTNRVADPAIEPQKLFDDLYVIGDDATVVYVLDTPDGLILIDAFYPEKLQSVLLPGMTRLGLDPARVKLVLVTHGHVDHYGGAAYFQATYGAKVGVSEADWNTIASATAGANKLPRRDLALRDGEAVSFGGVSVIPIATPGHTPGSMGFIFPVKDGGRPHMAAVFGSSVLTSVRPSIKLLKEHVGGIAHFKAAAAARKVDVELQNHPLFDGMWDKAAALKARVPGDVNPFVVGAPAYGRFMDVMSECMKATLARKGAKAG